MKTSEHPAATINDVMTESLGDSLAAARGGSSGRGRDVASSAVRIWLACLALLVIASVPVLINRHPPLMDYPWHVARVVTLAQ